MENNQEKETKKNPAEGMVGIRETLRDMGFSDAEIGYQQETGTVTLGGKPFMKPGYLDSEAGVSYAPKGEIQNSLVKFYQNTNNPVVRVSDAYGAAAGKYGLSADGLTYGNGTVSVGGTPISILYIDDEGKAWARENEVNHAVGNFVEEIGVASPESLANLYERRYLSQGVDLMESLLNRKEFSYRPEEDPVYLAYQQMYQREGERAGREATANMAALTGGYASSAAVTAGGQARQYYAKQISDVLPKLEEQAYQRYMEEYQADLDLLGEITNLYDTAYNNAADANGELRENVNQVTRSATERDNAAWERNWKDILNQQDLEISAEKNQREAILDSEELKRLILINENLGLTNENLGLTNENLGLTNEKLGLTNQGLELSNRQEEIYLAYYEMMLQEDLSHKELENRESEIFLDYYERLLNKELWTY